MAEQMVSVPASLMPAAASELRDKLRAAVQSCASGSTPLVIEIDEGPVLPCALQMLVSTGLYATDQGVTLTHGPRAESLLDGLVSAEHAE